MKTLTYYMADDTKKERGVEYIQYDTLEEALEARGKVGVLELVNERIVTVTQGKASGKKNLGKAKEARVELNTLNDARARAQRDPALAAQLKALGLLK